MSRCRETAGLLFKHPCPAEAVGHCTTCGKPICSDHARQHAQGVSCVACMRQVLVNPHYRPSLAHLRDDPYFYWYFRPDTSFHDPYGAEDYALFEGGEHEFGAGVSERWHGS